MKNQTMSSTNETAQPVNPAITEADVLAFVSAQNEIVKIALADAIPFAIGPDLYYRAGFVAVTAYLPKDYVNVTGTGSNTEEALADFLITLADKAPSPAKLRAEAAAKLAEAEALEAKQGGSK